MQAVAAELFGYAEKTAAFGDQEFKNSLFRFTYF